MKRVALIAAGVFVLCMGAAAAATAQPAPPLYEPLIERDPTGQFVIGTTTAAEVRATLGDPIAENRNRDGRFVYMYLSGTNDYTSYLFDKAGVLRRVRTIPRTN